MMTASDIVWRCSRRPLGLYHASSCDSAALSNCCSYSKAIWRVHQARVKGCAHLLIVILQNIRNLISTPKSRSS